ncbi:MAG TPA: chemotaxis protein CheW, partial [Gemmatimonadaceae bacterium]|nr:chemotaxis protein CheW [Gemmatimonadaceae bacterium]
AAAAAAAARRRLTAFARPSPETPRTMSSAEQSQIVTFRLGEELFAADIFSVERVLRYQQPTSIPNVPLWIEGVIDYQGRVVPVINLRRRFDLAPVAPAAETRILIFNAGGEWIGATVDAVLEVAPLDRGQVTPPPALFRGLAGEYLRGIFRRADRLVMFLDVQRLLTTTERLTLEQATGVPGNG